MSQLVIDLASQVRGLTQTLNQEIAGKKQKDDQILQIQDQYFRTLQSLRAEIGDFKSQMESENKQIKDHFGDYKRYIEFQQSTSSADQR